MINYNSAIDNAPYNPAQTGETAMTANLVGCKAGLLNTFWFFFIGSIAGFIIETIWCIIKNGRLECRSSLIFVPFTVVYGIGAAILHIGLHNIDKSKTVRIFMFGAVAGTAIEYCCSLFQEMIFGSVSWNYSGVFLNLNGRVCLLYSIFWGQLAILWVVIIQPLITSFISKIPPHIYATLTLCLVVFLIIDAIISITAVARWGLRLDGAPATNLITMVIDKLFPNQLMTMCYPNMIW